MGLVQEAMDSEGGNSEASSHVDQLISAFEHISAQQPKTKASDAGKIVHALCQSKLLSTVHAESSCFFRSLSPFLHLHLLPLRSRQLLCASPSAPAKDEEAPVGTGLRRHAVQATTLKQLSEASPMKEKASLHQQLAALQEDLQVKQAQIVAQRKDLDYRQHLLQYAAGPCSCLTPYLKGHSVRASRLSMDLLLTI